MFRYVLRRILWSIPTLLATTFFLFLITTLAPDWKPRRVETGGRENDSEHLLADREEQARRSRFLDLPRFVNVEPLDVRERARVALSHIAAGDAEQETAGHELVRLGGAALPFVLPGLEALPPDARRRLAVALAPLAERMALAPAATLAQPDVAALFWTRLWDDRALDFTQLVVTRTVARLVEHGSDLRADDLVAADTFALQSTIQAMRTTSDPVALARLTRIAAHAAQRGPELDETATELQKRRAIADWSEWWFTHAADFVVLDGVDRVAAVVTETRYGKWLKRIASGELGVSMVDGEPVADKLLARAPVTLLLCALAMLVSFGMAVPLGVLGAWWRGQAFDVTTSSLVFVLYSAPTFAVAELLRRFSPDGSSGTPNSRLALAVAALAAGSVATLSRWQRAALLDVLGQDFVRTARAKGAAGWRVLVVHALRNALAPTVTVAGVHLPALLGSAMVVEEIFGLHGVGFETLRAIESRDAPWLMAVLLATATSVTFGLILSDVAYGALDPRIRELLVTRGGREAL